MDDCFYDRGDVETLRSCSKPNCILVGRTGSGKTALLFKLEGEEEHVISIEPESLSLQYLSNSTILPQLEAMGVNLGLFYKLLWRHIFAVELIKAKYSLRTESDTRTFMQKFWDFIGGDKPKERAIKYLVDWGKEFWQDTEYRVREITSKLEKEVKDSLGAKFPSFLEASTEDKQKQSLEEKAEIVNRLQDVVNSIQVRELDRVIKMLAEEVFHTEQPRYYVVLDKLDEDWVEDDVRYKLIKALIETVKDLNNKVRSVKIVLGIRRDLLERVIQKTKDAGFQEEKYEALYLNLKWTKEQLFDMLDRRVNKLVRAQYTQAPVSSSDLMPKTIGPQRQPITDFLVERTMFRPRDLIIFFNICIEQATGKPDITPKMILNAEEEYSQRRLRSLYDEWRADYPELPECVALLKKRPAHFHLSELACDDLCLTLATGGVNPNGELSLWAAQVVDQKKTVEEFRNRLTAVFYKVGLVGLKTETFTSFNWSFLHAPSLPVVAIKEETILAICPVFYRVLGIDPAGCVH